MQYSVFRKTIITISFILMLNTVYGILNTRDVLAQEVIPLTVSPARQEVKLNPGQTSTTKVTFYNRGSTLLTGAVKITPFEAANNQGNVRILKENAETWIQLSTSKLSLQGMSGSEIQVVISASTDAEPGGRYFAVYFEPETLTKIRDDGAIIVPRIASLIYITVAGDIVEDAMILNTTTNCFCEYGPVEIAFEILNRSNIHIAPVGQISLSDFWGNVIESKSLDKQNVYPQATRQYTSTLGPQKLLAGRYKLQISGTYGTGGKTLQRSIYIWIFPWKLFALLVLAVFILYAVRKAVISNVKT